MVIQGTKVPIYTNTLFLYFLIFSPFFFEINKTKNENTKKKKKKKKKRQKAIKHLKKKTTTTTTRCKCMKA